jgi:uncharacterized protein involved in exopolysaccharide biosynthesis
MEDEIDLRQYFFTAFKHWKLIIIFTAIVAVIALVIALISPIAYQSVSRVVIIQGNSDQLLFLAKSNSIAENVSEKANHYFETTEFTPAKIMGVMKITQQGNIIEFSAQYGNADKASFIANGYAQDYTKYVNEFYQAINQSPEEARNYVDAIKFIYTEKSKALIDFESNDTINTLNQKINDLKLLIDIKLFRDNISLLPNNWTKDTSIKMAFLQLENQAFSVDIYTALFSIENVPPVTLSTIDSLISVIETRSDIPRELSIDEIKQQLSENQSQLDTENINYEDLKNQMNAALTAYKSASSKLAQAEINQYSITQYVKVTDNAIIADSPLPDNRRWINVVIATVFGFIVAIILAFILEYFKNKTVKPEDKAGGKQ